MEIEELEEGQKILFNDRKKPLEVIEKEEAEAIVEGPGGATYVLYRDGDTALVAKEGNRRYSSYLEELREVGEWNENERSWTHSKTGARVEVVEEGPVWKVELHGLDVSVEQPKYGFTRKEDAVEKARKVKGNYPEGKADEDA